MTWRLRSFWAALGAVAYVAIAAHGAAPSRPVGWLALPLLAVALGLGFRFTMPPLHGEDPIEPLVRRAGRAAVTGAAVLVAARLGPGTPGFLAVGHAGAAMASMAGLLALARMGSSGGLAAPPPGAARLDAVAFASLFWTVAVALPAFAALSPARAARLDPLAIDHASVAASIGSLLVSLLALARARRDRGVELGVGDRARAALLLVATLLAVSVGATATGVAKPAELLPLTAAATGLCVAWCACVREPADLGRTLRVVALLAASAAPLALFAAWSTRAWPGRVAPLVLALSLACAGAGLLAARAQSAAALDRRRFRAGFEAATRAAMAPEPQAALESALRELRRATGVGPSLYVLDPPELVTVDLGGYARTARADLPAGLLELADREPDGILRDDALRSAEVRRPEIRHLLAWLVERGIGLFATVRDAEGPIGALSVPRGRSEAHATLEEVRALRTLADRLGAVIGVSAMLSRSRSRELQARAEIARLSTAGGASSTEAKRSGEQLEAFVRTLSLPAREACYSAPARAAVEQIERTAASGQRLTLLSRPGVDAVAYAALAHLASPRSQGGFAVVDGADPSARDLALWRDGESSPLRASLQGTLVLLDAQQLPLEVQSYIGAALREDAGLVVAVPRTVDSLVAAGSMHERLGDRLGDRAIALPVLVARAEDLHALALRYLARAGARLCGRPIGLDLHALQRLGEHDWPGNEAELEAVLVRAALATRGDLVGVRELAAAGLVDPERASAPSRRVVGAIPKPRRRSAKA